MFVVLLLSLVHSVLFLFDCFVLVVVLVSLAVYTVCLVALGVEGGVNVLLLSKCT